MKCICAMGILNLICIYFKMVVSWEYGKYKGIHFKTTHNHAGGVAGLSADPQTLAG